MRTARLALVAGLLTTPAVAQDPPPPVPVLPTTTDTTTLRATLRLPLDPPEYRFHFDATGRCDVLDRTAEAGTRIAAITATLANKPTDAERYDELRLWHHRRGDPAAARECAVKAARWYRERLRTDPYNV